MVNTALLRFSCSSLLQRQRGTVLLFAHISPISISKYPYQKNFHFHLSIILSPRDITLKNKMLLRYKVPVGYLIAVMSLYYSGLGSSLFVCSFGPNRFKTPSVIAPPKLRTRVSGSRRPMSRASVPV